MNRKTTAVTALAIAAFFFAMIVSTGPRSAALAQGEDQLDRGCTNASLRGTYGFFRTGTTAQGPLAAVGMATYDGFGFFTATQTISRNGVFTQVSFGGTYEINSDCSGRLLSIDGQSVTGYLSVVDKGNEIFMLSASAGNAITGISKRVRSPAR